MRAMLTIMRRRNLSSNTMATLVLAWATKFEMVPNRTHRKRRNSKNGYGFSRVVRSARLSRRTKVARPVGEVGFCPLRKVVSQAMSSGLSLVHHSNGPWTNVHIILRR